VTGRSGNFGNFRGRIAYRLHQGLCSAPGCLPPIFWAPVPGLGRLPAAMSSSLIAPSLQLRAKRMKSRRFSCAYFGLFVRKEVNPE